MRTCWLAVGTGCASAVLQTKTVVLLVACPFKTFVVAVVRVSLLKVGPAWVAGGKGFAED